MNTIKNLRERQLVNKIMNHPENAENVIRVKLNKTTSAEAGKDVLATAMAALMAVGGAAYAASSVLPSEAAAETLPQTTIEEQVNDVSEDRYVEMMTEDDFWDVASQAYFDIYSHVEDPSKLSPNLLYNIQSTIYLCSKKSISPELEQALIEEGAISPELFENIMRSKDLICFINPYNQQTLEADWKAAQKGKGQKDINHLINPAQFCFDPEDKTLVDQLFRLYFEAYDLTPNSIMNGNVQKFHDMSTQLNAPKGGTELYDATYGARYCERSFICNSMIEYLHDYIQRHYADVDNEAIREYYNVNGNTYEVKMDYIFPEGIKDEMNYIALVDAEESRYARVTVLDDLTSAINQEHAAQAQQQEEQGIAK